MKELRESERFSLELQARIQTLISKKKEIFDLKTKDISSSGAFILTDYPFKIGTRFKLSLEVSNDRIKRLTGSFSLIDCNGAVVRATSRGVGVQFDKGCRIWRLKG